jgi:hypothetical protein
MHAKLSSESSLKSVCSISELAKALGLSRGRFYQLVEKGVFPSPLYDIRTRHPFYTQELQQICQEVRGTNIGYDGHPILFYTHRRKDDPSLLISPAKKLKKAALSPVYDELVETLTNMGVRSVTSEQVREAFQNLHPDGKIENMDQGLLIRQLFRHFKTQV